MDLSGQEENFGRPVESIGGRIFSLSTTFTPKIWWMNVLVSLGKYCFFLFSRDDQNNASYHTTHQLTESNHSQNKVSGLWFSIFCYRRDASRFISSESAISSISLRHSVTSCCRVDCTSYGDYISKTSSCSRPDLGRKQRSWTVQFLTRESRRHGQIQKQCLRQTSISNLDVSDWYDGRYDSWRDQAETWKTHIISKRIETERCVS